MRCEIAIFPHRFRMTPPVWDHLEYLLHALICEEPTVQCRLFDDWLCRSDTINEYDRKILHHSTSRAMLMRHSAKTVMAEVVVVLTEVVL